ncbi:MAG: BlaI/MecI/CopY family transcriptional regulator [Saprospiraceae bacterium]|nr:BlaI/MecI/CopY family transcriptional regulator [Saprospiraceae bacterium]MCB9325441.1 BlaI/MecI/CopY family transcriptional regulator [Lewinellaceae bacterium]
MQKLSKREEEIMQVLWQLEKAFVKEVVDLLPEPKPHYNTVSTVIRILEDKKFIGHKSFGKTYQYYPLIEKETYQNSAMGDMIRDYFDNSYKKMIAYFAKEEKISEDELDEILKMIKNKKS